MSEAASKSRGGAKARLRVAAARVEQPLAESRASNLAVPNGGAANARKLYESERAAAEASLARADAEHATSAERVAKRVRELPRGGETRRGDSHPAQSGGDATRRERPRDGDALGADKARKRSRRPRRLAWRTTRSDTKRRRRRPASRGDARRAPESGGGVRTEARARPTRGEQAAASRGEYVEFDPSPGVDRDGRPRCDRVEGRAGRLIDRRDAAKMRATRETRRGDST